MATRAKRGPCECIGLKMVLEVYGDDHGRETITWIDSETEERTEMVGTRRTVKIRCGECERVFLDRMPFPGVTPA